MRRFQLVENPHRRLEQGHGSLHVIRRATRGHTGGFSAESDRICFTKTLWLLGTATGRPARRLLKASMWETVVSTWKSLDRGTEAENKPLVSVTAASGAWWHHRPSPGTGTSTASRDSQPPAPATSIVTVSLPLIATSSFVSLQSVLSLAFLFPQEPPCLAHILLVQTPRLPMQPVPLAMTFQSFSWGPREGLPPSSHPAAPYLLFVSPSAKNLLAISWSFSRNLSVKSHPMCAPHLHSRHPPSSQFSAQKRGSLRVKPTGAEAWRYPFLSL